MNVEVGAELITLASSEPFGDFLEPILSYFLTGFGNFVRADFEFFLGLPPSGAARSGSYFLFWDILDFDFDPPVFGGFFSPLFMLVFNGNLSVPLVGDFDASLPEFLSVLFWFIGDDGYYMSITAL